MKKSKKLLGVMLSIAVILCVGLSTITSTVEAAPTGEQLIANALKYLNSHSTIACVYSKVYQTDGLQRKKTGMVESTSKLDHGFFLESTDDGGWEEYLKGNKLYKKRYSVSNWRTYTQPVSYTSLYKALKSHLGHLKNIKITGSGTKNYTLTARSNYLPRISKIIITINKNTGAVSSIKYYSDDYKNYYTDSGREHTVKNEVVTLSNIYYGNTTVKLPNEL